MRKEVLIAVILGFTIGIIIAYGAYTANKAVKQAKVNSPSPSQTSSNTASPLPSSAFSLIINEPENNLVLAEKQATVSGQTEPKAVVAVLSEEDEKLLVADNKGLFSTTINLIAGLNEIKITSINSLGEEKEQTLNIIHSQAKIE